VGRQRKLYEKDSLLMVLAALFKYGPARDALETAWTDEAKSGASLGDDVVAVHRVLCAALRALNGVTMPDWVANCGKVIGSGYVNKMINAGLLLKPTKTGNRALLKLGETGNRYVLQTKLTKKTRRWLQAVCACARGISRVLDVVRPGRATVWTFGVYKSCQDAICKSIRKAGLGRGSDYLPLWLSRVILVVYMRRTGVHCLQLRDGLTVTEFGSAFPDQKCWLHKFGKHTTVQALFDAVGYDGPPELFTMYACNFGARLVQHCPIQFLEKHEHMFAEQRTQYAAEHGQQPHPAVLVQLCLKAAKMTKSKTTAK